MPSILIVQKNGDIKSHSSKSIALTDLYKKAGFKSQDDFKIHANWKLSIDDKPFHIHLFGKITGRANQENKFEFPPPVDSTLFFGSCVLVNILNNEIANLSEDDWEDIYETLMGGFEDLGEADSSDASSAEIDTEEELELTQMQKTKSGYAKDGFVVDDDDEEESEEESDESSYEPPSNKKKNMKTIHRKGVEPVSVYECMSELSEEEYVK